MDQARSSSLANDLSEKWSSWDTRGKDDPHEARSNERSVRAAVFNQCMDFLPQEAVAEVIERGEDSPVLLAVDGKHLYALSVGSPGTGQGPATTEGDRLERAAMKLTPTEVRDWRGDGVYIRIN